jgi:hypothetical protein
MSAHVTAPVYVPAIYVVHLIVAQNLLESELDLFSPQCSAVVSCQLSAEASAEALAWSSESQSGRHSVVPKVHH